MRSVCVAMPHAAAFAGTAEPVPLLIIEVCWSRASDEVLDTLRHGLRDRRSSARPTRSKPPNVTRDRDALLLAKHLRWFDPRGANSRPDRRHGGGDEHQQEHAGKGREIERRDAVDHP